ncbi:MFS transporter [Bacillus sp. 1NLA3E]|uniref:MFS transporter n=1 Tax=Bacillus sp. 1NLA3E TaxID=666686 RepID=UPI000247E9BD|nr:MFS transporter [Bacillus sp. 1NLA3E]AGK53358.1 major facilitator superfamily permease [Bacillus sp. 1NLA3E]
MSIPTINQLNEKYSIRNGIAQTIVLNGSNNYFILFAISVLGASNYQVGLINSLPQFIGMFGMLVGSVIMNKLPEKRKFTAYSFLFTRLFLLGMFFVVFIPREYSGWVFVLLVGFMNLPGSFANLSWQAFIGDLVPEKRRSGFFSQRNMMLTLVGMVVTFIIGIGLQFFSKTNPIPYQFLFLLTFIAGIFEVYYLLKHVESKKSNLAMKKSVKVGMVAFKDKRFVYFLICGLCFNFTWQMAWALFSIFQIKYAHATGFWISVITVANQIGQIVSYKWWGRMADKYGNAKMMIPVSLGMAAAPVLTILSKNMVYLTIINGLSGLFVSGTVLLLFNLLLEVTNKDNRDSFISQYNILLAIVGFIAPQFGVLLLEQASMSFAMITSTLLRISSGGLFIFLSIYLTKKPKNFHKITIKSS